MPIRRESPPPRSPRALPAPAPPTTAPSPPAALAADTCGLGAAFEVIGGKWKAVILWELRAGAVRFGELKRRVPGVSEKILIQSLREMERHGVVRREVFGEVPPRVEYSITPLGASLNEALGPLATWGMRFEAATGRA